MTIDMSGNVYFTDRDNHNLCMITPAGRVLYLAGLCYYNGPGSEDKPPSSYSRFNSPHGVAVDNSTNIYVADTGNHTIRKVIGPAFTTRTLGGSAGISGSVDGTAADARFFHPSGLAVDEAGVHI